ncbi:MAG: tetratricopeptide repeat protein [Candidatus Omnitrophica bacterium]|nr:tetratricopeptide repeat protein [Candidatus Omnitrophota bacterium]
MRLKVLLISLILMGLMPCSFASQQQQVREANELFKKKQWDSAIDLYLNALEHTQNADIVQYDLGAAFYKKGNYDQAIEHLKKAESDKNKRLSQKAAYNLGNAQYKKGLSLEDQKIDEAITSLQKSTEEYTKALSLNSKDQDADYNRKVVEKELERLKEKKKDQQQKQDQKQDQKNESSKKDKDQSKKDQQQNQNNKDNQDKQNQQNRQDQKNKEQQNQPQGGSDQQNKKEEQESGQQNQPQEQKQDEDKKKQDQQQASQETKDQKKTDPKQNQAAAEQMQSLEQKQAKELLETYEREDAPKGILNFVDRHKGERHVDRDW